MAKLLLVEDDMNLREIYAARLQAEGFDVATAADGEEALATAVKEKPDLILLDVMMPKISGFDVLDILRSTPETKNAKVIMMTALSQQSDRERGERLGTDKYLVKSQVTLEDVVNTIKETLAQGDGPSVATVPVASASADDAGPGQQPAADTTTQQDTAAQSPAQTPDVTSQQPTTQEPTPETQPEPTAAPAPTPPEPQSEPPVTATQPSRPVEQPTPENTHQPIQPTQEVGPEEPTAATGQPPEPTAQPPTPQSPPEPPKTPAEPSAPQSEPAKDTQTQPTKPQGSPTNGGPRPGETVMPSKPTEE